MRGSSNAAPENFATKPGRCIGRSRRFAAPRWPAITRAASPGARLRARPRNSRPSRRQRRLGLADDCLERHWLADGQIGQDLAVDRDARLAQPVDEPAVVEAERAHRRVESLDPQGAERALLALAVAIGVLRRLLHRLLGDADGVLAPAVIALGGLEHLLVPGVGGDATLDAGHG